MTKKEYCLTYEPIAVHDYYYMQIHGIEYGVENYAYISRIYKPRPVTDERKISFHRVKINTDFDGISFVKITEKTYDGKKHVLTLFIDNFIRVDSGWRCSSISCVELKSILKRS